MLRKLSASLLSLAISATCFAELSVTQRVEDYLEFWNNTRDTYVFHEWKHEDHGVLWDSVKQVMLPRVENSTTDLELYQAIGESQAMLRDGHCYNDILDVYMKENPLFYVPIKFTLAEGKRFFIGGIRPGEGLEEMGMETGDEILRIDGKSVRQFVKDLRPVLAASSEGQFYKMVPQWLQIHHPLLGKPSSPKREMTLRKPDGSTYDVSLRFQRIDPKPEETAISGFASDETVSLSQSEQLRLEGPLPIQTRIFTDSNIGYLSISSFMKVEDSEAQLKEAFESLQGTDGLLLDLRGNGGGVLKWGILMANYLIPHASGQGPSLSPLTRIIHPTVLKHSFSSVDAGAIDQLFHDPNELSEIVNRFFGSGFTAEALKTDASGFVLPFPATKAVTNAENQIEPYDKPIYVLMDGGCYSTTDMLITLLKSYDRATFVGTPNGAGGGSPTTFKLSHSGITVHLSTGIFTTPQGTRIEGRPTTPDILASQGQDDLIQGVDTVLNVAAKALWEELNPGFSSFASEDFKAGESSLLFESGKAYEPDFGEILTPDWILSSEIEQKSLK